MKLNWNTSDLQGLVDDLSRQVAINRFQLNEGECKELRISFSRSPPDFDPIVVNSKDLESVQKAKILGVTFSVDFKWNAHVNEIVKKVNKRLYFLRQLKRAQVKLYSILHVLDLLWNTHAHFFTAAYLNIYQLI